MIFFGWGYDSVAEPCLACRRPWVPSLALEKEITFMTISYQKPNDNYLISSTIQPGFTFFYLFFESFFFCHWFI
jgi:hypothetical protein